MAGNEQHPANDVEGHGPMHQLGPEAVEEAQDADAQGHTAKWGVDTEAVDDNQVVDDVEGHSVKFKPKDTPPADDTQGHFGRYTGLDTEGTDEDQVGDDTEGHAGRYIG